MRCACRALFALGRACVHVTGCDAAFVSVCMGVCARGVHVPHK